MSGKPVMDEIIGNLSPLSHTVAIESMSPLTREAVPTVAINDPP